MDATQIRRRLAFDVERLRTAADRLDAVEQQLTTLRKQLEARAQTLSSEATDAPAIELAGDGLVQIRYAQAQATANLARRATLGEVLKQSGRLSLIASMAVNRWVWALMALGDDGVSEGIVKGHIDAGRVAHRMLATLRPKDKLKSGCGQITSAVVVAEFVAGTHAAFVAEQIEEGLHRGRHAIGLRSDEDVLDAASRALRAGAELLESMCVRAEPAALRLLEAADAVESDVESKLSKARTIRLSGWK